MASITIHEDGGEKFDITDPTKAIELSEKPASQNDEKVVDGEKKEESEEDKPPAPMVPWGKLYSKGTTVHHVMFFVGILGNAVMGTAWIVWSIIFGELINSFDPNAEGMYEKVVEQVINMCLIGVGAWVSSWIGLTCNMYVAEAVAHNMKVAFVKNALRQEPGWFESHSAGELTSRLNRDTIDFAKGIGDKVAMVTQSGGGVVAGFIAGFFFGWQLALFTLAVMPFMAGIMALFGSGLQDTTEERQNAYAKAGAKADEALGAMTTVAAFGGEQVTLKRYTDRLGDSRDMGVKIGKKMGQGLGGMQFVMMTSYGVCLFFGVWLIYEGVRNHSMGAIYTGGDVMTVFFCILIAAFSLGPMGPYVQDIYAARAAAYRMFQVIEREPKIDSLSTEGKKFAEVASSEIKFENVSFEYPTRPDDPVFTGFNLTIKANQTVAFVGESGSGKSTIVRLLQRFYDPSEGHVSIGGIPLTELNLHNYRQNIAVVAQEPVLFEGTVRENIMFGYPEATDADITRAAQLANAEQFIVNELENGYESQVGEGGSRLSGGQKQRIGIARALVRNPKILLLDEATSALDNESEKAVQDALAKVMKDHTVILVAHRLTTVKDADCIFMLEKGTVKEQGTHEELLAADGAYANLVKLQIVETKENMAIVESKDGSSTENTPRTKIRKLKKKGQVAVTIKEDGEDTDNKTKAAEDKTKEVPEDLYPMSRVFDLMTSGDQIILVKATLAAILSGATQPMWALLFGEIVTVFFETNKEKQLQDALFWALLFVALGFLIGTGEYFKIAESADYGERLTMNIRSKVFEHMMNQEIGFFDRPENNSHKMATRLDKEAAEVHGGTTMRMSINIQMFIMLAVGVGLALYYSWALTLAIIVTMPLMGISAAIQNKFLTGFYDESKNGTEESAKLIAVCFDDITTVLQLSAVDEILAEYLTSLEVPLAMAKNRSFGSGFGYGFSNGFMFCIYGFCYWAGAVLISNRWKMEAVVGVLTFGDMMKCMFAIMMGGMASGQAAAGLPDMADAISAKNAIFKFLDRESEINPAATSEGKTVTFDKGAVKIDNVQFAYPTDAENVVLKNFSLNIPAHSTLALTGFSGHGKSTIVSLLMRFYDKQKGSITIDGMEITDCSVKSLRSQIGYVKQEPVLFDCSVAENIRFGKADATVEEIKAACIQANAWKFISQLSEGLDTQVGAKGSKMSGGQKQRIALARALVRKPRILLLDEATSALDAESERVVQEAFDKIIESKTMTIILIAHRLNTIKTCDQIAFVENGTVAEVGTHDELVGQQGLYYDLVMNA